MFINNIMLSDNYLIIEKLGSGSFGDVYLAEGKIDKKLVAAKVEDKKHHPKLYKEYKIYKHLEKAHFRRGLPQTFEYYQTDGYNIMFMQLLGKNLEEIYNDNNRSFNTFTVFNIGYQIIELLESMHNAGYLHRDIKPNNFLIDGDILYITDFGLSKKYIVNSKHIKYKDNRSLVGTARYASVNVHMGIEPSRRDDLESVGYMLIYFLKGVLPWQSIKKTNNCKNDLSHIERIGEAKICTNPKVLCEGIHRGFYDYLVYCKGLKYDETPDYNYLKKIFFVKDNVVFEWNKKVVNNNVKNV